MDGLHMSEGKIFPIRKGRGHAHYDITSFKIYGIPSVSSAFKWDRKHNICRYAFNLPKEEMCPIVPKKAIL